MFSSCCEPPFGGYRELDFYNNSDYEISMYSIIVSPISHSDTPIYPDTALPSNYMSAKTLSIKSHGYANYNHLYGKEDISIFYNYYNTDTISFFIFSTDTLVHYAWDSIRNSYKILQRYDISVDDFLSLFSSKPYLDLTFPPSPKMCNIKMWPPYGTYDENGHRIK